MRTKAASIAIFLNLLGATWGVTRKKSDIKLEWLEDAQHGEETLPHMKITFADGENDEIYLRPDPEDKCFFHGALKDDIESEVEVKGCKNKEATVAIVSRLIPCSVSLLFLDESGETFSKDGTEGVTFSNTTDEVPSSEAAWTGHKWEEALPRTVTAKFHVRIERSLVDQEGGETNAKNKVRSVIKTASVWFKKRLGLPMDIDLEVQSMETYYGKGTPIGDTSLRDSFGQSIPLQRLAGKGGRDHPTAWFKAPYNQNITHVSLAGIAQLRGLCNETSGPLSTFLCFIQSLR